MSIARLKKLTLLGPLDQKHAALENLQDLGCMHILPLAPLPDAPEKINESGAKDAYKVLRFLGDVPKPRRQVHRDPDFDMTSAVEQGLTLMQRIRDMGDRRDFLAHRITQVRPWGDLEFPPKEELAGNHFWFYRLPVKHRKTLDDLPMPWAILHQDHRSLYVVLIAPDEPADDILPAPRTHTGSLPIHELEEQLEEAEIALEGFEAERIAQTRYLTLMRRNLAVAETQSELAHAEQQVLTQDELFAVQGWVPEDQLDAIRERTQDFALLIEDPAPDELPPTLLEQPQDRSAGVDLAMFYQVPNYNGWDPTLLLIGSFAMFFAMIVADAGYGFVILGGLLAAWAPLGRTAQTRSWRRVGLIISAATIAYGVAVGSYFGTLPPGLSALQILDLNNFSAMMLLSILIGVAHLVLANALAAHATWGHRKAIANLGWIAALAGGLLLWLASMRDFTPVIGGGLMGLGLLTIFFFSSDRPVQHPIDWLWRLLDGGQALAGAMGAFGDVLSYMRLFALGLASASLAVTFNDLALTVMEALPGLGILLGVLILLIGHALNFALALMSGVVHGLRLNYIEFYKWGLPEEGVAFRKFARKEVQE